MYGHPISTGRPAPLARALLSLALAACGGGGGSATDAATTLEAAVDTRAPGDGPRREGKTMTDGTSSPDRPACVPKTPPAPNAIDPCGLAHRPLDPKHLSSRTPSPVTPVTVRLETVAGDVQKVTLRVWNGLARELPMTLEASAGGLDLFRAEVPASARTLYYRFRLEDGSATLHLTAGGARTDAPTGADDFWIAPQAPPGKTLHYQTDFAKPELRVQGAGGSYATIAMSAELAGVAGATGLGSAGQELFFHVRDAATGKEDHPPGGGDYRLAPDLVEAWLAQGTVFDVDPATLGGLDMIDAHTHPYGAGFAYDPSFLTSLLPAQGFGLALTMVSGAPASQASALGALHKANRWILPLAWVNPNAHGVAEIEDLLKNHGFKGLKFHPVVHGFNADSAAMDPFMQLAATYRVPVQIHAATDEVSRPWRIVALAKRHPTVPVIMVHIELGTNDKTATLALVKDVKNLYVETSWCNPQTILQAMSALDSSRTLLGTDSTVDGAQQFTKQSIANPQGQYVYTIPAVIAEVKAKANPGASANWARLTAIRLYGIRFRPDADLLDSDGDGLPDLADPDQDNDGEPNAADPAPLDPSR